MQELQRRNLLTQARTAFSAGRLEEARSLCRNILSKARRDVNAWELLGLVDYQRGDFTAAAEHFRKCVKLEGPDARFDYFIGLVLADQGRSRDAIARFDKALAAQPGREPFVLGKVAALDRIGDHETARSIMEPIVTAGDASAAMVAMYARTLNRDRRYGEAVDLLRRTLDD
ncbi:MAG: tetratricopeptide repeat protein, partial [Myxococcota bacterium]